MTTTSSTPKSGPVRFAIVGTGGMAASHAHCLQSLPHCEVVAAADIDAGRVAAFCRKFGIPGVFTSVDDLLRQADCDAVVVATTDAAHLPVTMAALRAGCHVLCEKPLALNHADAMTMVRAARRARRVNLVNFSYRNWPALQEVARRVRRGDLGEVRHVEASYLQSWLASKGWGDWRTSPSWLWRLSTRHGSQGTLGDIGVHILDFASYPVGDPAEVFCRLQCFPKAPRNRVGAYVLDANDSATINVVFRNGALGVINATRWAAGHVNRLHLKISGTRGAVEIDSDRSTETFRLCAGRDLDHARWREVKAPPIPSNHERFLAAIRGGAATGPDFARGAAVQRLIDACFTSHRTNRPVRLPAP